MNFIYPDIISTADGSNTLYLPEMEETYHSRHGAIRESAHVFIQAGLSFAQMRQEGELKVFEMGFGTGLNAMLALAYARQNALHLIYHSIEKFPVDPSLLKKLHFAKAQALTELSGEVAQIITGSWDADLKIGADFILRKIYEDFLTWQPKEHYDVIFYDAFGFRVQEELWSMKVFDKTASMLKPGGVLVTYAAKGSVRRNMQQVGLLVERLPGAPGKREMLRATKPQGV